MVIHSEVQFAAPLWVHRCRAWDMFFALVGLIGVVYLRADAIISEIKPSGKSFIAPTSVAKENKRKNFIDSVLIIVLLAILAFDLTQAGMAFSKMNLDSCVFEQQNREIMTRLFYKIVHF